MPKSLKNPQTGFAGLIVLALVAVLIAGGFGLSKLLGSPTGFLGRNATVTPIVTPKACTLEAKICPDGSAVSRVAPDCNFASCPSSATPTVSSQALPTQTSPSARSDADLNADLKSLEDAAAAVDSGIGNIDQSLSDKPDNLTE